MSIMWKQEGFWGAGSRNTLMQKLQGESQKGGGFGGQGRNSLRWNVWGGILIKKWQLLIKYYFTT